MFPVITFNMDVVAIVIVHIIAGIQLYKWFSYYAKIFTLKIIKWVEK